MNERQPVDQEVLCVQTLTDAISVAPDLHSALSVLLLQICQVTGWDYGEAWIPVKNGTVIELSSAWHINTSTDSAAIPDLEQFRLCSESLVFPPAIGLPGRVWSSKQPEWIADARAQSETYFLRNQIAKAFGVRAGFGVPILASHQVLAVLVFFMLAAREEDRKIVELVTTVASHSGLLLQAFLCDAG